MQKKRNKTHGRPSNWKIGWIGFLVVLLGVLVFAWNSSEVMPVIQGIPASPAAQPNPVLLESPGEPLASPEIPQPSALEPGLTMSASTLLWGGNGNGEAKQIGLTFDAGWEYEQTLLLLDVLDQYQVKATFFLRGGWVKDHPDITKEIGERGHMIGNHSMAHGHMNAMTKQEMYRDISESTEAIGEVIGYAPTLFRPPYGEYNDVLLNLLGEMGYRYTVMWTVDAHDWAETMNDVAVTEEYLIDRVLSRASDNGIVLMHVGGHQTVNALPEIIEGLRAEGYELVTLEELIQM